MKLFYSKGACSLAPHIVLKEAEIPFELEGVNLKTKHYSGGDFTALNPKGYVPVIQLANGEVLTEAAVIMQYLADQKPEKNLVPKFGTMERYRCLEWAHYVSTELHKGFGSLWNEKYPEDVKQMAREQLHKKFEFLDKHLAKSKFLMGETFTFPDAYLFTVMNWSWMVKLDISMHKNLVSYMERVKQRPSVQAALAAEGLK